MNELSFSDGMAALLKSLKSRKNRIGLSLINENISEDIGVFAVRKPRGFRHAQVAEFCYTKNADLSVALQRRRGTFCRLYFSYLLVIFQLVKELLLERCFLPCRRSENIAGTQDFPSAPVEEKCCFTRKADVPRPRATLVRMGALAGDISLYGERTDKNIFCRGIPQNV